MRRVVFWSLLWQDVVVELTLFYCQERAFPSANFDSINLLTSVLGALVVLLEGTFNSFQINQNFDLFGSCTFQPFASLQWRIKVEAGKLSNLNLIMLRILPKTLELT